MEDLVGHVLVDRYRLVARLAGGGMGEVYRGHDNLLDRAVAVKVLQPRLASDLDVVERFRGEARAAARLSHPNVVGVYDWGSEDDQTYFMVMEYVPGTDARDLLVTRGWLEPAQAVEVMAAVCDALASAHRTGLVHRDVKPENILIARDGTVKVADFGIAVIVDGDRTAPGGAIPGTLRYLSPEQARGDDASAASDLWAAGAVLCELLTGAPPLQGAGGDLLRRRATEEPVPPSQIEGRVPRELDEIVVRACALEPAERYEDASEMANALRRVSVRSLSDAPSIESMLTEVTGEIHLPEIERGGFSRHSKPGRSRRLRLGRLVSVFCVLALVLLGGVRAYSAVVAPDLVIVPSLIGMRLEGATEQAQANGLDAEVVGRRHTKGAPRGEVLSQLPVSGKLREGSAVELVVSSGPPIMDVPDLVGVPRGEAEQALVEQGLVVGEVLQRYSARKAGVVVQQFPAPADRLRWGEPVRIVLSKGPLPTKVPSVAGMTLDDAKAKLAKAGFEHTVERLYSDAVERGAVVATAPESGAMVPAGDTVRITVSRGPEFKPLELPDVRGMTSDAARRLLEGKALRVRVVQSCDVGDTVADSDPIAGTTVRENDVVALFLC